MEQYQDKVGSFEERGVKRLSSPTSSTSQQTGKHSPKKTKLTR